MIWRLLKNNFVERIKSYNQAGILAQKFMTIHALVLVIFCLTLTQDVLAESNIVENSESQVTPVETSESQPVEVQKVEAKTLPESSSIENQASARSSTIDDVKLSRSSNVSQGQADQIKLLSNSGSAYYEYPLDIPIGRGNTTPELALMYNSQSLSDMSPFGYGWDIGIPYIERLNKIGASSLYATSAPKYFNSSFSGELVQVGTSTKYVPKNEFGDFIQYEFVNDSSWLVTDKGGAKYYFGIGTSSKQTNPQNTNQTFSWMLEKVGDLNGNFATYTYIKDGGMIYPNSISYSNHASSSGIYSIAFVLKDTTVKSSAAYGFYAKRTKLVEKIRILVNSQLEKEYNLNYSVGINENRDLLSGVIVRTYGSNSVILPETKFSYEGDQLPTWTVNNSATFPEPNKGEDIGVRFGDLNGDGLTDIVRYFKQTNNSTSTTIRRVHLNKGDGTWDVNVAWDWDDIQVPFTLFLDGVLGSGTSTNDLGTRLVDVNGDGLDDLTVGYVVSAGSYPSTLPVGQTAIYINTGSGFKKNTSWNAPGLVTFNQTTQKFEYQATAFLDVNGDNLADVVSSFFTSNNTGSPQSNTSSSIGINTGTGWASSSLKFPAPLGFLNQFNGSYSQDTGVRTVDVNGDGLLDVLRGFRVDSSTSNPNSNFDDVSTYINTGNGWATSSEYTLNPIYFAIPGYPQVSQNNEIADINGDSLPDIVKSWNNNGSSSYASFINTGNGWLQKSYNLPFYLNEGFFGFNTGKTFIDFDGDTITDVWDMGYVDQLQTQTSGGSVIVNNAKIPDRLTTIAMQTGGTVSLAYDGFLDTVQNNYQSIGTTSRNPVVLSKVTYDSGNQNNVVHNYTYAKGHYSYASTSIRDRKFAGFETIEKSDSLGKTKTYYHQGNNNASTSNETNDDVNKIGQSYKTEVYNQGNNLYQTIINSFATSTAASGSVYTKLTQSVKIDYDGDADNRSSAVSFTYDNTNGNVLTQSQWGEVTANQDGSFTDIGTGKKVTTYTYASNTALKITGLPATERLDNQSGTKITESKYYYDTLALGLVNKGNLTKTESWSTSTNYINTQSTYNSLGLKIQDRDPRGNATNYAYDAYNLYPASTSNALGHNTRFTYDYTSGKVKTTIDPNGFSHVSVYDGLDRLLEIKEPVGESYQPVTIEKNTYNDTPNAISVQNRKYLDTMNAVDSFIHFDGHGRVIQTRQEAEKSGQFSVRDTVYGTDGNIQRESLPYFSNGSARTTPTSINNLYTTYTYDALNRKFGSNTVFGNTTMTYDQWQEVITDTLGNQKKHTYDAYSNLAAVLEQNGTSTYTTTYGWTTHNQLAQITDALGNIRRFFYDGLTRRLSAEDLHAAADITFGIWNYAYDNASNIATTTDPKGQIVVTTYDALNRPKTENFTAAAGTEVTYTYDTCTNGIGRLCVSKNAFSTTTKSYRAVGIIFNEEKSINGNYFFQSSNHDFQGNPIEVFNTDGSVVRNTYNGAGKIEKIQQKNDTLPHKIIVSNFDYGPHGMITKQLFGNGTLIVKTYDENQMYRLSNISTFASSTLAIGGQGIEAAELQSVIDAAIASSTTNVVNQSVIEPILQTQSTSGIETLPTDTVLIVPKIVSASTTTASSTVELELNEIEDILKLASSSTKLDKSEKFANVMADRFKKIKDDNINTTSFAETGEYFNLIPRKGLEKQLYVTASKNKPEIELLDGVLGDGFKVSYDNFTVSSSSVVDDKIIRWRNEGDTKEVNAYPLAPKKGMEKGGFELEVVLKEKPESNIFEFALTDDAQYTFEYQAQLTERAIKAGKIRPENVIGSYAVFTRGTDPRKVMHIYRPKIHDAVGKETWGTLAYSLGKLTVVVPQEFLDNATYPVVVDPTFGNSNAGESGHEFLQREIFNNLLVLKEIQLGNAFTASSSGLLTGVTVLLSDYDVIGTIPVEVQVYEKDSVATGTHSLIASSVQYNIEGGNATDWHTFTFATGTVISGKEYILTIVGDADALQCGATSPNSCGLMIHFDDIGGSGVYIEDATFGSVENPWNANQEIIFTDNFSIYASYEDNVSNTVPFASGAALQNLSYAYDSVGNILKIIDRSPGVSATTTYTYDPLYRLTRASTTQALNNPYVETYTYNAIGNMTNKTGSGVYQYAGNTGSLYANPHAPTTINGVTQTYDRNGNLASTSATTTNTWDYRNRLLTAKKGTVTTTYRYDTNEQRLQKIVNGITTTYGNRHYETTGATTTNHIYAGGVHLASVVKTGTSTYKTYFTHPDHLGSTHLVTSASGNPISRYTYYPYGSTRTTLGTTTYNQPNQFLGEDRDPEADLSYLNHRYYSSNHGQFRSQDPVFWEVGESRDGTAVMYNPQAQNSYSYAQGNPTTNKDPDGRCGTVCAILWGLLSPDVAYAPNISEEENRNISLESTILLVGFVSPSKNFSNKSVSLIKGTDMGKLGTVGNQTIRNATGYSEHGLNQKINRSVSTRDIVNTVRNPGVVIRQSNKKSLHVSAKAAVVLDSKGKIITTYGSNDYNQQLKSIERQLKDIQKQVDKLVKEKRR